MTLRDLQVTKEKLMRSNPSMRPALSRLGQTTSSREHFRLLIEAGQKTPGYSGEVRKWQREIRKIR